MKLFIAVALMSILVGCETSSVPETATESQGAADVDDTGGGTSTVAIAPQYFQGTQLVNRNVTSTCFVEVTVSADGATVDMRAIVTHPHKVQEDPATALVGVGVQLQQKFLGGSIQANGYAYEDATPSAPIKQVILFGDATSPFKDMRAALFHDGHHDPVRCGNLELKTGADAVPVVEMYAEFAEMVENLTGEHSDDHEGHDHD